MLPPARHRQDADAAAEQGREHEGADRHGLTHRISRGVLRPVQGLERGDGWHRAEDGRPILVLRDLQGVARGISQWIQR